jgi:hypothetical protein
MWYYKNVPRDNKIKLSEVTKMVKASTVREYVKTHLEEISAQEIGKCTKVYDFELKQNVYLVENSRDLTDDEGNIIEYKVTYDEKHGFRCSCPCGQTGFSNVKHPSRVCRHVRASIAAAIEETKALAEIARQEEERRIAEEEARKAVPIEVKWDVPAWMLSARPAPHMRKAPKEL